MKFRKFALCILGDSVLGHSVSLSPLSPLDSLLLTGIATGRLKASDETECSACALGELRASMCVSPHVCTQVLMPVFRNIA